MKKNSEKGSATVEAIISLSMFLFAFIAIYSIINMCIVQSTVQHALNKSAKEISQYYYFIDKFKLSKAASGKGLDEASKTALGVFDTFEAVLEDGKSASSQVSSTVENITNNDISVTDIQKSVKEMEGFGTSAQNLVDMLVDASNNPADYLKSFAALAVSKGLDETKINVATSLAKGMSKRHFDVEQLESMGVKGGFEGMDFSQSRILQKDNPEDVKLVVVYELEVADFLPFDFSITISQSAVTRGWAGNEVD